jgi:NADH-quinone oxidoreductase subunit D
MPLCRECTAGGSAELTRIQSHQLWWACFGMDLGALTTFFYGLRDREMILDIWEETTGGRFLQSWYTPGGFLCDIHPNFQKRVKDFVKYFRKILPEYDQLLTGNVILQNRTRGVGMLSKEEAINMGASGPVARGSGVVCDIRKKVPYGVYDKVNFKEVLYHECDTLARYKVRMDEMWESMDIIDQLVDNIPEGDYKAKMKPIIRLPEGEYYQRVETARGELGVYVVSKGDKYPWRIHFRTPNLNNLFTIDHLSRGMKIADLVAIGGSLDLIIPDIDR